MNTERTAKNDARPRPPHNWLIHIVGYVEHGCAACDWLRDRGHLPPITARCPGCGHACCPTPGFECDGDSDAVLACLKWSWNCVTPPALTPGTETRERQ